MRPYTLRGSPRVVVDAGPGSETAARSINNHDQRDDPVAAGAPSVVRETTGGGAAAAGTINRQSPSPYTTMYPNLKKFLVFAEPAHNLDYKAWQRRNLTIVVQVVIMLLIGVPNFATRFNWPWAGPYTETTAQFVGQLTLVPLNVLFALYVGSLTYQRFHTEKSSALARWATWILTDIAVEDLLCLCDIAANAAIFIGRVQHGACTEAEAASIWLSQQCNPVAHSNSFPLDSVVMLYLMPALTHVVLKGISLQSVVLAYAVSAGALIYAIIAMDGWVHLYTLLWLPGFVAIAYIVEYDSRISFVQHMQLTEFAEAAKQLEGLDTKRRMVRHIAHEIRTPLNTMVGCLGCLNQELNKLVETLLITIPPAIFDLVTQCGESCNEARNFTSDLLSFEKIAAGLEQLELEMVPFLEYVYKTAQPFIFQARAKDVVMTVDAPGVDPSTCVRIDPLKMAQVLRNFFANAVKFTPAHHTISVVVRGVRDTAHGAVKAVKVLVTDNGPGLTAEELGQLFQVEGAQFNANQHQGGGGSGLGLFIAKGIVNLHEGATCGAKSLGRGRGSTFFVTIPVAAEAPAMADSSWVSESAMGGSSDGMAADTAPDELFAVAALNILLVDDSAPTRKLMAQRLTHLKHRCFEADDGLQALTLVRQSVMPRDVADGADSAVPHYDAVCMDNNMITMHGPEAATQMRLAGFDGPIIGITGDDDNGGFLDAGADVVLVKPVLPEAVLEAIADAMTRRRNRAQSRRPRQNRLPRRPSSSATAGRNASFFQVVANAARKVSAVLEGNSGDNQRRWLHYVPSLLLSARVQPSTTPQARTADGAEHAPRADGPATSAPVGVAAVRVKAASVASSPTDEAMTVRWQDLVTYTLDFTLPEHKTKEARAEFDEYRRAQLNFKLGAVVVLLGITWTIFRILTFTDRNSVFNAHFFLSVAVCPIIGMSWFLRLAVISRRDNIEWLLPYHDWAVGVSQSRYHDWCENAVMIIVPFKMHLLLLANLVQSACPPGTMLWDTHTCNYADSLTAVPVDMLLFAFVDPVLNQMFMPGSSNVAVAVAWLMAFVFFNTTLILSGNTYSWINLLLILGASVSYEYARAVAVSFAKMRVQIAARQAANTRAEHAMKMELRGVEGMRDGMQLTISRTGHDLKSPVTAMGMALEATMQRLLAAKTPQLLSTSPRGGNGALLPCAEAYAALMHLRMIVNRSQDYARILAHVALKPSLRAVNVLNVVRSVVQWKALSADVPVVIEPAPAELVEVGVTDASWLEDNLLCVIDNACKVTQRGSGAVGVFVRTVIVEKRKLLEITVKDRGEEALSDAQLKALFDRPVGFRRDAVGGMGTGMCCLAARVKALGPGADCGARRRTDNVPGTAVWMRVPFEAPADPGSDGSDHGVDRMTLFLNLGFGHRTRPPRGEPEVFSPEDFDCPPVAPMVDTAAATAAAGSVPAKGPDGVTSSSAAVNLAGQRILVVDDSAPIRKVMQRNLKDAGAIVETAVDGQEAVQVVTGSVMAGADGARFNIIVTDIQMPKMDGWAASKAIRALPGCAPSELVIVGMSAQGGGDLEVKWKAAGMDGFMDKPFGIAKLLGVVQSLGLQPPRGPGQWDDVDDKSRGD